jgi:hypothetical protein
MRAGIIFGIGMWLAGTTVWPAAAATTKANSATMPAPKAQADSASAAVVTPLLQLFEFGNAVGLPLACDAAASVLSNESAVSPIALQLVTACQALSQQGDVYLREAITASRGLAFINPAVNPAISALASQLRNVGGNSGPLLSPMGPTIAGLGGTVAFFEGS